MQLDELLTIMTMLRDPEHGCPWDLKQDFASIAPHTLEEAYEVVDAIEQGDYGHLRNELGDLLFQVVFYAQLGKEAGLFDFNDIVEEISTKLLQRHPHVFPEASIASFGKPSSLSPEQVEANWERIKQAEREEKGGSDNEQAPASLLNDVPQALPALNRARKLQKRAANAGFDWDHSAEVLAKLREEVAELEEAMAQQDKDAMEDELGDLLFSCVNLSRHLGLEPEASLRRANRKFEARFRQLETLIREQGLNLSELDLGTMEEYWQLAKKTYSDSATN